MPSGSAAETPGSVNAAATSAAARRLRSRSKDELAIEPPSARGRDRCGVENAAHATKPCLGLHREPGKLTAILRLHAPSAAWGRPCPVCRQEKSSGRNAAAARA